MLHELLHIKPTRFKAQKAKNVYRITRDLWRLVEILQRDKSFFHTTKSETGLNKSKLIFVSMKHVTHKLILQ